MSDEDLPASDKSDSTPTGSPEPSPDPPENSDASPEPEAAPPNPPEPETAPPDSSASEAAHETAPGEKAQQEEAAGEETPQEGATKEGAPDEAVSGDGAPEEGGTERRRRRRRRIVRWTSIGLAATVLITTGAAYGLYRRLDGNIDREDSDQLGKDRPAKLNKSLNFLVLGSDTREGANARYGAAAGISGARADTAILMHLSPNRDRAVAISFPRDSMVQIPECRRKKQQPPVPARFGQINSAFSLAGPTCTWKTIEQLTDIHIDHFLQVDFTGFKRMVDALGGVEICVPEPVHDPRAELTLKAGRQTVKGDQALGYVRARYTLGDGSDLERIKRQQRFMAAVVDKATGAGLLSNPARTYDFLSAATESLTTDDDLTLAGMRRIADGLRGMSSGKIRFITVPIRTYAPDPNRVQWDMDRARPLFQSIRHDDELPAAPPPGAQQQRRPPAPSEVTVSITDAGARDRLVRRTKRQLGARGFKIGKKVGKAGRLNRTEIRYAADAELKAGALASVMPAAVLVADRAAAPGSVTLVIGGKGARLKPPPAAKAAC